MKIAWFFALMASICFEGLGRRYLPQIPTAAFYFIKDAVLLLGYFKFRPPAGTWRITRHLYRGFHVFWVMAFAWTLIQVFNPEQKSSLLALIGVRAYWLWWIAPPLIAHVLRGERDRLRAIYVLLAISVAVAGFAVAQFLAPPDSSLNVYSYVDGEKVDMITISSTGRARVSSTFSFISGFSDFTILVPTLLLSIGLDARDPKLRRYAFLATGMTAAVLPMSGSRASVLIGAMVLFASIWSAGLFFTRIGRRILIGGIIAAVFSVVVFPDAFLGVQSRFGDEEENKSRYLLMASAVLPPLAIATVDHPPFGIGTGMLQNARMALRIPVSYEVEQEFARYLVELGTLGFLVIWAAKLGLVVALLRARTILRQGGRRGAATAAFSYAILTMIGNLTFDHIWQSLYFIGCGFILSEVVALSRANVRVRTAAHQPISAFATAAR